MDLTPKPAAPRKRYLVGINQGGPAANVTLGGVSFPVMTSETKENGAEIQRSGAITNLTAEDLLKIQKAAGTRVVRWVTAAKKVPDGRGGLVEVRERLRAQIWDINHPGFYPEEGDEPLANYIYIEPASAEVKAVPHSLQTSLARELELAAKSERDAKADPKDKATRDEHAKLKAAGKTLTQE